MLNECHIRRVDEGRHGERRQLYIHHMNRTCVITAWKPGRELALASQRERPQTLTGIWVCSGSR